MLRKCFCLSGAAIVLVLLLSPGALSQELVKITGRVVDKDNVGIANARIWVMRGAETLQTTTSSKEPPNKGSYTISYKKGSPVDILYECTDPCDGHATTIVKGISGGSNNDITKVLPPRGAQVALSLDQASEVIATFEYLQRNKAVFSPSLVNQLRAWKEESVPDELRDRLRDLQARADTSPIRYEQSAGGLDVVGTWDVTVETAMGSRQSVLKIERNGGRLTAVLQGQQGSRSFDTVTLHGNEITLKLTANAQGQDLVIQYRGKVTKGSMKGEVEMSGVGGGFWSAVRRTTDK